MPTAVPIINEIREENKKFTLDFKQMNTSGNNFSTLEKSSSHKELKKLRDPLTTRENKIIVKEEILMKKPMTDRDMKKDSEKDLITAMTMTKIKTLKLSNKTGSEKNIFEKIGFFKNKSPFKKSDTLTSSKTTTKNFFKTVQNEFKKPEAAGSSIKTRNGNLTDRMEDDSKLKNNSQVSKINIEMNNNFISKLTPRNNTVNNKASESHSLSSNTTKVKERIEKIYSSSNLRSPTNPNLSTNPNQSSSSNLSNKPPKYNYTQMQFNSQRDNTGIFAEKNPMMPTTVIQKNLPKISKLKNYISYFSSNNTSSLGNKGSPVKQKYTDFLNTQFNSQMNISQNQNQSLPNRSNSSLTNKLINEFSSSNYTENSTLSSSKPLKSNYQMEDPIQNKKTEILNLGSTLKSKEVKIFINIF